MFATLNQRWLIDLREREIRALTKTADNAQPSGWLEKLVAWFKQPI